MRKQHVLLGILGIVLALGLSQLYGVTVQTNEPMMRLTVSAAISLKEALEDLQPLYQQFTPQTQIRYNFGGSGALQQQIEQGAPVDLYISAAVKQMDALQAKGLLVDETRRNLLTNQLVLITPKGASSVQDFQQLTRSTVNRIAMGEPRTVPAGQYAEEVLRSLGILEQVKPKLVLGTNVRQVLTAVASGNAEAGMVYATDAVTSEDVQVVAIAKESWHSPIVYPVAILKASKQRSAAQAFTQYLTESEASRVFESYGFAIAKQSS